MRHSQHTDNEILHLLYEAETGVSIAEICRTAHISLRTFYRWRKRYGSLTPAALTQMKELQLENQRLRSLVSKLSARPGDGTASTVRPALQRSDCGFTVQGNPGKLSGQVNGTSSGRFAFVRGTR